MKKICTLTAGVVAAVGCACVSDAALLVEYTFTGSAPGAYEPSSPLGAGVASATAVSIGSGLTGPSLTSLSGNQVLVINDANGPSTLNPPSQTNDYIEFSITPASPGLNLDNMTLQFGSGAAGTRAVRGYYSFDGFATSIDLPVSSNVAAANVLQAYGPHSLTDQNPGQNTTTSTVTFRIFAGTGANGRAMYFDNIQVHGSVVPEPASLATLALAASALGMRRRRA